MPMTPIRPLAQAITRPRRWLEPRVRLTFNVLRARKRKLLRGGLTASVSTWVVYHLARCRRYSDVR